MRNVGLVVIEPMSVTVAILAQGTHWAVAVMQAFLHTLDTSGAPEQDTPGGALNTAGRLSACPRHITPPDIPAEELNTSGHVRDPCGHVLDSPGHIRTYLDLNI